MLYERWDGHASWDDIAIVVRPIHKLRRAVGKAADVLHRLPPRTGAEAAPVAPHRHLKASPAEFRPIRERVADSVLEEAHGGLVECLGKGPCHLRRQVS